MNIFKKYCDKALSLYPFRRGSIDISNEDIKEMTDLWYRNFNSDTFAREARRAVVGYAIGFVEGSSNYIDLISKEELEGVIKTYNYYFEKLEEACKLEVDVTKADKDFTHAKMQLYAILSMIADYVSKSNEPMCKVYTTILSKFQQDYILDTFSDDTKLAEDRAINTISRYMSEFTLSDDNFDLEWLGKTMNVLYENKQYSTHSQNHMKEYIKLYPNWINYYAPRILVAGYTKALKIRLNVEARRKKDEKHADN